MPLNMPMVSVLGDFQGGGPPNLVTKFATGLDTGNGRGVPRWSCSRGRNYELAQSQAGTASITVDDPQETLNPGNLSSPLNTAPNKLALYRGIGLRAWWPREGNTLNAGTYNGQTTTSYPGFHPGFEGGGVNGWYTAGGTITNVTTSPRSGTRCLRLALDGPVGSALAFYELGQHDGPFTFPGKKACYSAWVRANAAGMTISFTFGGVTSASTSSTAWTRLSVTVDAVEARTPLTLNVTGGPSGAGTQVVFLDDEQLEFDVDTPGPFVTTGPIRYAVWTGYIERYPQQWIDNGYRGVRPLECVDSLSVLSRTIVRESYSDEVLAANPSFYFALDDATAPARAQGRLAGTIRLNEFPAAKGGTVSWGGDTLPDGSRAVSLSQQLVDTADVPIFDQVTFLDTRPIGTSRSAPFMTINTGAATFEFWIKVSASFGRAGLQGIQSARVDRPNFTTDTVLTLRATGGRHYMNLRDRGALNDVAASASGLTNDANLEDGQWHYCALSLRASVSSPGLFEFVSIVDDGYVPDNPTLPPLRSITNLSINSVIVSVAASVDTLPFGDLLSKAAFARLAFYPRTFTQAEHLARYRRGIGNAGQLASDRVAALLSKWWGGAFEVGPSSGLTLPADFGYTGASVLAALESITGADEGTVYSTRLGVPRVESSLSRHQASQRTGWVFGEDVAAGELPYESISFDFDPNYVYSHISVTRPGRSSPIELVDDDLAAELGQRVYSRSIDVQTDFELLQAAYYLQRRYGQTRLRVQKMVLSPDTNPALWPVVLTMDPSRRVTIRRRTSQGTVISGDYYVESVNHDVDHEASTWSCAVELSPVFVDQGWVLGDSTLGVLGQSTVPVY